MRRMFFTVVLALCIGRICAGQTSPGLPVRDPKQMETWWADLEQWEPASSRAMLGFATRPDDTVAFLKEKMTPLKLSPEELRALVKDLGSDKETVWKAAFERFEYLDPRLAMDLPALMDEVTTQPARNRLIAVLGDRTPESIDEMAVGEPIRLMKVDKDYYNFMTPHVSWEAWANVKQLANRRHIAKKTWERADRAIIVLGQIGTPGVLAIVKAMATGHPDADPTQTAARILLENEPSATRPAVTRVSIDALWADLESSLPPGQEAELKLVARPAEAVAFFKTRLAPLNLSEEELQPLLESLASDKETDWKPAFEKLEYFDPRLAMELPTLMRLTPEEPARSRLAAVLTDCPPGTDMGRRIRLSKAGPDYYDFFSDKGSWGAEHKVSRLESSKFAMPKRKWRQAMRAELVLGQIGTPEAVAILQQMATGNPEALPTRVANEELARLEGK